MSSKNRRVRRRHRRLAFAQGLIYLATGLWPVVALRTFEAVTGRKKEGWLVRTTGGLIALVGAALARPMLFRRRRGSSPRPDPLLGFGSAALLGAVDVVGVASGRLRWVYLLDALMEAVFAAAWAVTRGPAERRGEAPRRRQARRRGRGHADGGARRPDARDEVPTAA